METQVTQHCYARGMTYDMLRLLRPVFSEDTVTFYQYNLSGRIIGYLQYRPAGDKKADNDKQTGKYYIFRKLRKECITVGGLETYHRPGPLFVVEGVWDFMKLAAQGVACVYTCGVPSREVQQWLIDQPKPVVSILDPDVSYDIRKAFVKPADVVVEPELFGLDHDVGDCDVNQVKRYITYAHEALKLEIIARRLSDVI